MYFPALPKPTNIQGYIWATKKKNNIKAIGNNFRGLHRLERYFHIEDSLEKSLNETWKSTGKLLLGLEKVFEFTIFLMLMVNSVCPSQTKVFGLGFFTLASLDLYCPILGSNELFLPSDFIQINTFL